jgi:hypothetical protein
MDNAPDWRQASSVYVRRRFFPEWSVVKPKAINAASRSRNAIPIFFNS